MRSFALQSSWISWILITCSAVLALLTIHNGHSWDGDAFGFMEQARAIYQGTIQEYIAANSFITNGGAWRGGPVAYPWGFPLLLAGAQYVAGDTLLTYKLVGIFSWIGFLVALWWAFQRELSSAAMIFLLALFAFHPWFLNYAANEVMSDIPGLLSSFIALVAARRILTEKIYILGTRLDRIALGLLLLIAVVIRTMNIFVLGAVLISQGIALLRTYLSQRNIHALFRLLKIEGLPLITFILGYMVWMQVYPKSGTGYATQFFGDAGFISKILHDKFWYIWLQINLDNLKTVNEFFPISEKSIFSFPLLFTVSLYALYGMIKSWEKNIIFILFIILYSFFFSLIGSLHQGLRYYICILPIIFYFFVTGVTILMKKNNNFLTFLPILLGWSIVFIFFFNSTNYIAKNIKNKRIYTCGPYTNDAKELYFFISKNTKKNDIIIFFRPRILYAMTHRRALPFTKNLKADYVCRTNRNYSKLSEPSERHFLHLEKRYSIEKKFYNDSFSCYKIINKGDLFDFTPYSNEIH